VDIVKSFHEQNISTMDGGSITGMNGLIIGIAKLRGIKGISLLGETSGYIVDAKASKSILETLLSMIHIRIDMTSLEKKSKDTEVLIQAIEQQVSGRSGKTMESQHGMTHKPADTGYIS
jgi:proteasome assembly chaperone (PAC2) family protein